MLETSTSSVTNCTFNKKHDSNLPTCSWCIVTVRGHLRSWYVLEADISSILCKDDVTYKRVTIFETKTASRGYRYPIKMYNVHATTACVHDTICHFKFPKVVWADILGDASTRRSFVKCFFQDMSTIFFKIRSYLTDIELKISWHLFFETRCTVHLRKIQNNTLKYNSNKTAENYFSQHHIHKTTVGLPECFVSMNS